jgi:hypothetical protein
LQSALVNETKRYGGIRRSFVHRRATGDPVELFLAAMAWGFGTTPVHYPKQKEMLTPPYPAGRIAAIVKAVQSSGAGWSALFDKATHVTGLGPAFGTKLLYFAGYKSRCPGPRHLILDGNVHKALKDSAVGLSVTIGRWRADYECYLEIAAAWAADQTWTGNEETVELALFEYGKTL